MNEVEKMMPALLISMRTEVTGIRTENVTMKMQILSVHKTEDETSSMTQKISLRSI